MGSRSLLTDTVPTTFRCLLPSEDECLEPITMYMFISFLACRNPFLNSCHCQSKEFFNWEGPEISLIGLVSFIHLYYLLAPCCHWSLQPSVNVILGTYVHGSSRLLFYDFLTICRKHSINGHPMSCLIFIAILRFNFCNCFSHYPLFLLLCASFSFLSMKLPPVLPTALIKYYVLLGVSPK